jgi:hypothetical protein
MVTVWATRDESGEWEWWWLKLKDMGKARIELLGQQMLHATIPVTDG